MKLKLVSGFLEPQYAAGQTPSSRVATRAPMHVEVVESSAGNTPLPDSELHGASV